VGLFLPKKTPKNLIDVSRQLFASVCYGCRSDNELYFVGLFCKRDPLRQFTYLDSHLHLFVMYSKGFALKFLEDLGYTYGVASISRLLKIIGVFCRISSL